MPPCPASFILSAWRANILFSSSAFKWTPAVKRESKSWFRFLPNLEIWDLQLYFGHICPSKCCDTSAKHFLKSKCPGAHHILTAHPESSSHYFLAHSLCSPSVLMRKKKTHHNDTCIHIHIPLHLLYCMCLLKCNFSTQYTPDAICYLPLHS